MLGFGENCCYCSQCPVSKAVGGGKTPTRAPDRREKPVVVAVYRAAPHKPMPPKPFVAEVARRATAGTKRRTKAPNSRSWARRPPVPPEQPSVTRRLKPPAYRKAAETPAAKRIAPERPSKPAPVAGPTTEPPLATILPSPAVREQRALDRFFSEAKKQAQMKAPAEDTVKLDVIKSRF